ncbi:ABC transporter permease [Methylococcus sp. EFPC2]|uniref:ABC transporter permease n=1 Tax=Methylococcus sp. EFPC2 TaxID=2812648 RepID=UPI00196875BC|nr:ABC transporter permease [Methylococcus sp. EFPC2]QSA95791.1 ABC transporter permease [Methylococcus sp. EFPC2]
MSRPRLRTIFHLGLKELRALRHDLAMLVLIVYGFTVMIYVPARNGMLELRNATVAVVDEDRSQLAARLTDALRPPFFRPPVHLDDRRMSEALDRGRFSFVLDIPPRFEADVLAGRQPALQLNVDATAMSHAGIGSYYIASILKQEVAAYLHPGEHEPSAATAAIRLEFNENRYDSWFLGVMMMINVINLLAIVITGAALIREREHGTLEHLLVMPVSPLEIMLAKIWANGLVVLLAVGVALQVIVRGALGAPLLGSTPLFMAATALYLFAATSIGIFLATVARSMPQLGLLSILVVFPITTLSGNTTPLDSMPEAIQRIMACSPSTHFVKIAQAVLYRGAGVDLVWQEMAWVAGIGSVFFLAALLRFRRTVSVAIG